jgi:hypothetical protein
MLWFSVHDHQQQIVYFDVVAPLTARSDIQQLYRLSPFSSLEIEFPPGEITQRYQVRVWDAADRPVADIEAQLQSLLRNFYTTSIAPLMARLSSVELTLSSLEAEQSAKTFEMGYLKRHYPQLRAERISLLHQEIMDLGRQLEEARALYVASRRVQAVQLQMLTVVQGRVLSASQMLCCLLAVLCVGLLQQIFRLRRLGQNGAQ